MPRGGGFAWEVQLGRQHRALRRLQLEMKVARPPGIDAGHDRLQAIAALVVGELVTPQTIAGVVVVAAGVGVPDVDQRARHRLAAREPDDARDDDLDALHTRLEQRRPLRRGRLEIGTLGLSRCRLRAVRAARRRLEWLWVGGAGGPGP